MYKHWQHSKTIKYKNTQRLKKPKVKSDICNIAKQIDDNKKHINII